MSHSVNKVSHKASTKGNGLKLPNPMAASQAHGSRHANHGEGDEQQQPYQAEHPPLGQKGQIIVVESTPGDIRRTARADTY